MVFSVFDYLGKDEAEVNRSEEEVNKIDVVSTVSTAQNPLEPVQNGLDTADSSEDTSSVVLVGDGDAEISRTHNSRARDGERKISRTSALG